MTLPPSFPPLPGADAVLISGELPVPRPQPGPPPPPAAVAVPATWLLAHGGAAVQYRLLRDIVAQPSTSPGWSRVPFTSRAGWHLLSMQDHDGTWQGGMLSTPAGTALEGVGTIPAYRRLLELGWDTETPGMVATKRLLFRLLAEDTDPTLLAELRPEHDDEELVLRGRLQLREAAAAALAQAGFEDDPRLRGAARRLIERVHTFFKSPLAQKPWMRVGNQHVLPPEVTPPSFHLLVMLSYMPQFRSEHYQFMDYLYNWLTQPWPRQVPMQQMGERLIEQPQYVLGDFLTTRSALDGDMPSALAWLETMARMGMLSRHEGWVKLLDRTLDDRSRKGVWKPPRSVVMPPTVPTWSWPLLPLGDSTEGAALDTTLSSDVTFRLALIAKLAGRTLDLL